MSLFKFICPTLYQRYLDSLVPKELSRVEEWKGKVLKELIEQPLVKTGICLGVALGITNAYTCFIASLAACQNRAVVVHEIGLVRTSEVLCEKKDAAMKQLRRNAAVRIWLRNRVEQVAVEMNQHEASTAAAEASLLAVEARVADLEALLAGK